MEPSSGLEIHGFLEADSLRATQHRSRLISTQPRTRQSIDTGFFKLAIGTLERNQSQSHFLSPTRSDRNECGHTKWRFSPAIKELPPTIRYHQKNGYIIVAMSSLKDLAINGLSRWPPTPRQDIHLIAHRQTRHYKRTAFKAGDDKRTFGQSDDDLRCPVWRSRDADEIVNRPQGSSG